MNREKAIKSLAQGIYRSMEIDMMNLFIHDVNFTNALLGKTERFTFIEYPKD